MIGFDTPAEYPGSDDQRVSVLRTFFSLILLLLRVDSPFDILGIESDATEEEIKQAYRRRVKETHPDQGGCAREFQLVRAAYEAIKAGGWTEDQDVTWNTTDETAWSDTDAGPWNRNDSDDQPPQTASRVEYLNYEVLDDYGWAIDDDDLFENASAADLDPADRGRFLVKPHESLLEAAENRGFAWPFACRGGACANCAVAVRAGELAMPVNHILPEEMIDRGFRLSCNGIPITDELKIVYNVKHLPGLDELRLPPYPFELAHSSD